MIEHLSHTQISMFRRCARQYYFRYIKGLIIPTAHMLTLGSSYHRALAENFKQKIISKADLPVDDIMQAFSDDWNKRIKNDDIDWGDQKPGMIKDTGISLVKKYQEDIAPGIQPIKVEHKIELLLPEETEVDIPIIGYVDLTDEGLNNQLPLGEIEHKTSSKHWNQSDADIDLQPFPYILWFQQEYGKPPWFRYHIAVKTKQPSIQILSTSRSQKEIEWYLIVVREVYKSIKAGIFPPTGDGWGCSEKWCGYWDYCRGGGRNF